MAGKGQITSERASSGSHATYRTRTSQRTPQRTLPAKRSHQGGYWATSGCACTHPREPFRGSRDLRSLPVALVLVLPCYILYYRYYGRKKNAENSCACAEHTSVTSGSGPLPVTSLLVNCNGSSLPQDPPEIWFQNHIYTTFILYINQISRKKPRNLTFKKLSNIKIHQHFKCF